MGGKKLISLILFVVVAVVALTWAESRGQGFGLLEHRPEAPALTPGEALEVETALVAQQGLPTEPVPPDSGLSHAPVTQLPDPATPRASFSVQVKDLVVPYSVMGLFVLPGRELEFETLFGRPGATYELLHEAGELVSAETGKWVWKAPAQPGYYPVVIQGPVDAVRFNVMVQHPFRNGPAVFRGYRVGAYQRTPLRGDRRFLPPRGMIEVSEEMARVRISPSFTLGAFASHQPGNPRYMVLDERLILKLEMLLDRMRSEGFDVSTFTVMSAFRTPWYNASIGNTTRYSLHLFGRAADIFVDEDGDGRMDDLNGNGREDIGDARVLFNFIDGMKEEPWYQPFIGGLGLYGPKPHRGPFVHVDVRGYAARW